MKSIRITSLLLTLAASGLFAGCAQTGEHAAEASTETHAAPAADVAATPAVAEAAPGKNEPAKTPAEAAKNAGTPPANASAQAAAAEPFQPPYPQRDNMFRRPNSDNANKAARAENNNSVELKGFVNVGGLRAVLVIDGNTVSVKQGEQRGEISVIEISPPKVILQRGRNRWTTQLFDPTKTAAAK